MQNSELEFKFRVLCVGYQGRRQKSLLVQRKELRFGLGCDAAWLHGLPVVEGLQLFGMWGDAFSRAVTHQPVLPQALGAPGWG